MRAIPRRAAMGSRPETFYDSRQTVEREFVSPHAKCVVVNEREVLVTSAYLTGRGQRQTGGWVSPA